jgi:hypothetical protein
MKIFTYLQVDSDDEHKVSGVSLAGRFALAVGTVAVVVGLKIFLQK